MLCNLLIFSGCVCHLEQLHAQSPFLFPIVFSMNLIPFFDIFPVDFLLFFHPSCSGMCCFTWAAARSQQLLFVVLATGLWCFTAGCHVKSSLFPQSPLKQQCAPRWEKALILKTIGNRNEIGRDVVRGDKHNLRNSANRNAQISVIHSAYCTDLCFAICRFSQVVFVTSNNVTHNLLFYFSPWANLKKASGS